MDDRGIFYSAPAPTAAKNSTKPPMRKQKSTVVKIAGLTFEGDDSIKDGFAANPLFDPNWQDNLSDEEDGSDFENLDEEVIDVYSDDEENRF